MRLTVSEPRVTIVTPTLPRRENMLIERCIPSVQRLEYDGIVDHIIVSDANPGVESRIRPLGTEDRPITVVEINDTWLNDLTRRCTGSFPWRTGCFLAHGEYVGFLGDDDEYLPNHVSLSVQTMQLEHTDFCLSSVAFYGNGAFAFTIGDASWAVGHLDATGLVCRREALRVANWDIAQPGEEHANAGDWRMVRDWVNGGLRGSFTGQTTSNHHDGWLTGMSGK